MEGAAGVGAGAGDGLVYADGELVGTAQMTRFTLGAQLGGERYREVLLFASAADFDRFKDSEFEFDAGATATAGAAGKKGTVGLNDGVRTFVMSGEGLIASAALGVQNFVYRPL